MERRITVRPVRLLWIPIRCTHTHTHTPQNKVSSDWSRHRSYSMSSVSVNVLILACRCRRQKSRPSSSCLTVRRCRSREWSRPLRPPSYSRHKSRLPRWEREMTSDNTTLELFYGSLASKSVFKKKNLDYMRAVSSQVLGQWSQSSVCKQASSHRRQVQVKSIQVRSVRTSVKTSMSSYSRHEEVEIWQGKL